MKWKCNRETQSGLYHEKAGTGREKPGIIRKKTPRTIVRGASGRAGRLSEQPAGFFFQGAPLLRTVIPGGPVVDARGETYPPQGYERQNASLAVRMAVLLGCDRVGGTVGDLNQVLLEHLDQFFFTLPELPRYDEVQDFPEWREKLWQNLDTLRQGMLLRSDYTRRQKDFFALMTDFTYLRALIEYYDILKWKNRTTTNPDSILAHLKKTYTLVDPHARELQFGRDGRSFYFPLEPEFLPYWEANGLVHSEVYEMTSNFAKAQTLGEEMKNTEVQTDSAIQSVHPYFQPILRAFNDTTRVFAERLQREAKDRIMTAPDVPGDQLLQAIAKQYPGKVVFFDLWATWCGPCKKGIEAMEPLKQQMKDKDVVFVYLTDESSPVGAWNSYVLKIPGLHYRIASLGALPGITGIPQYYLYDRQGQRVWEQTGFDAETLTIIEAEIQKALLH